MRRTLLLALWSLPAATQTRIDLQSQARRVDFTSADSTKPLKSGPTLPPGCAQGEMFFKTDAPAGANLYGCATPNTWSLQGNKPLSCQDNGTDDSYACSFDPPITAYATGTTYWFRANTANTGSATINFNGLGPKAIVKQADQALATGDIRAGQWVMLTYDGMNMQSQAEALTQSSGLTVQSDGNMVGTQGTVNFVAGTGLVTLLSESGSTITVQTALDTAVIQTQSDAQSGGVLYCASTGGSGADYQCSLSPTLQAYVPGMVLHWRPDVNGAGGTTTLNVDLLGAKAVRLADGAGSPTSTDIAAGRLYPIWYDGTAFRLPAAGGPAAATSPGGSNGQLQYNNAGAFGGISRTGTGNVASTAGATAAGHCAKFDGDGNIVDAGAPCGTTQPSVTISTSGPVTVASAGFYFNDASGALTYNLPAIDAGAIGARYCFRNAAARTGAITLQAPPSTYIDVDGVNGTAAGTLVSGGAAGDSACVVAIGTTQYVAYTGNSAWTNN